MSTLICPLQLRILMDCYTSPDGPSRITESDVKNSYIADLMDRGVISRSGDGWSVTEKGEVWLEAMLSVPEPEQIWVIPE